MKTTEKILAEATAAGSRADSLRAILDGIKEQIADALSGTALNSATQQKIDAIFSQWANYHPQIEAAMGPTLKPVPTDPWNPHPKHVTPPDEVPPAA